MTQLCLRWRARRSSYRPAGETIRTLDYEVAELADDTTAKAFVVEHHYSRTFPAAAARFALYRHEQLVGVAVFSIPITWKVLSMFPVPEEALELGRFVLLDDVPANGETWFLARAFKQLRGRYAGIAALSDPVPRSNLAGQLTTPGHCGIIYQAHNGMYRGRATARTLRLLPDGSTFSDRAAQKVRKRERGHRYAAGQLVAAGAAPLLDGDDSLAWLHRWLPIVTRPLKHAGNHKFCWPLDKAVRRHLARLEPAGPYPKEVDHVR